MKQIDWEQRTWDLCQELAITLTAEGELGDPEEIAGVAVCITDELIKQYRETFNEEQVTKQNVSEELPEEDGWEYRELGVSEDALYDEILEMRKDGWEHLGDTWHEEYDYYIAKFRRPKKP